MFSQTLCSSHIRSLTHSLSVCTQCPLHTQIHTHTPKCRNMHLTVKKKTDKTTHACTHTRSHVRTQGCGKSLAQAASYLSCKSASTGGCFSDNKAKTTWPPTHSLPAARALIHLWFVLKKKKKRRVQLNLHNKTLMWLERLKFISLHCATFQEQDQERLHSQTTKASL